MDGSQTSHCTVEECEVYELVEKSVVVSAKSSFALPHPRLVLLVLVSVFLALSNAVPARTATQSTSTTSVSRRDEIADGFDSTTSRPQNPLTRSPLAPVVQQVSGKRLRMRRPRRFGCRPRRQHLLIGTAEGCPQFYRVKICQGNCMSSHIPHYGRQGVSVSRCCKPAQTEQVEIFLSCREKPLLIQEHTRCSCR